MKMFVWEIFSRPLLLRHLSRKTTRRTKLEQEMRMSSQELHLGCGFCLLQNWWFTSHKNWMKALYIGTFEFWFESKVSGRAVLVSVAPPSPWEKKKKSQNEKLLTDYPYQSLKDLLNYANSKQKRWFNYCSWYWVVAAAYRLSFPLSPCGNSTAPSSIRI